MLEYRVVFTGVEGGIPRGLVILLHEVRNLRINFNANACNRYMIDGWCLAVDGDLRFRGSDVARMLQGLMDSPFEAFR